MPRIPRLSAAALIATFAVTGLSAPSALGAGAVTASYGPTNSERTFVVPTGVTSLTVTVVGGHGGAAFPLTGGPGGYVSGALPVTPGQVLYVRVGGNGRRPDGSIGGAGGWNGGGSGGFGAAGFGGGGGGGASDIRTCPSAAGVCGGTTTLDSRLVVAAGGGGDGNGFAGPGGGPGVDGGTSGAAGGGSAGTLTSAGVGGGAFAPSDPGHDAVLDAGGSAGGGAYGGGGGGGGWYGGGGGGGAGSSSGGGGGGGGSNHLIAGAMVATSSDAGSITISYTPGPASGVDVALAPASVRGDGTATSVATAHMTDAAGAPVAGDHVVFSTTDPDERIGVVADHGDGTYSATITASARATTATITATDTTPTPSVSGAATLTQTDAQPPAQPVIGRPSGAGWNASTFELGGTAEAGAGIAIYESGATVATTTATPGGDWAVTMNGVIDGSHFYSAKATDAAGNESTASPSALVRVDTHAPGPPTIDTPAEGVATAARPVRVAGSAEPGSTVTVREGGTLLATVQTAAGGGWAANLTLGDGDHVLVAVATDGAGNSSPPSPAHTVTLDLQGPARPSFAIPGATPWTRSGSVLASGTGEPGGTVLLVEPGVATVTVPVGASGTWSTTVNLSDGTHTLFAVALDALGNSSPLSVLITVQVDTVAPVSSITAGPNGLTRDASPSFALSSGDDGSSFECRLDRNGAPGGTWTPCDSPVAFPNLADGQYLLSVRATDPAGNTDASAATRAFTVDTQAPAQPVIAAPAAGAADGAGHVAVSGTAEAGARVDVLVDGAVAGTATATPRGAWEVVVDGLTDGSHTLSAVATDPAGNASARTAVRAFSVDTQVPTTSIVDGPSATTATSSATIRFVASRPASFRCRLDGGAWAACVSPLSLTGLANGPHKLEVRATDVLGHSDPTGASWSWTVAVPQTATPVVMSEAGPAIPLPPSAPSGPAAAPVVRVVPVQSSLKIAAVLTHGVPANVRCTAACIVVVDATVTRSVARRVGLPSGIRRLGRGTGHVTTAGTVKVVVRLSALVRRKLRRVHGVRLVVSLQTRATYAGGASATSARAVVVRT